MHDGFSNYDLPSIPPPFLHIEEEALTNIHCISYNYSVTCLFGNYY